ncbi:MAG: hypothetical protein JW841_02445 [Deltaproteobacteria bacterium]|nr:hypothetical protein [Deltaproteobacteria bacterium]
MLTITHRINEKLKHELDNFCEAHGLKQQAVVQEAIMMWLEDAKDVALIDERREGPWVEWKDIRDGI